MIDSIDENIIRILEHNAREGSKVIANMVRVSPSTVRRRIRTLIRGDILRISAVIDPAKSGYAVLCLVGLNVEHGKLNPITQRLTEFSQVRWVSITTGQFDVMMFAVFRTNDDLLQFVQTEIAAMEGVKDTQTFICLRVDNGRYIHI